MGYGSITTGRSEAESLWLWLLCCGEFASLDSVSFGLHGHVWGRILLEIEPFGGSFKTRHVWSWWWTRRISQMSMDPKVEPWLEYLSYATSWSMIEKTTTPDSWTQLWFIKSTMLCPERLDGIHPKPSRFFLRNKSLLLRAWKLGRRPSCMFGGLPNKKIRQIASRRPILIGLSKLRILE